MKITNNTKADILILSVGGAPGIRVPAGSFVKGVTLDERHEGNEALAAYVKEGLLTLGPDEEPAPEAPAPAADTKKGGK